MSESFEKAVQGGARRFWIEKAVTEGCDRGWAESAWDDMGGSEPNTERAVAELLFRTALRAALPHLTAQDVPHVAREAWWEAMTMCYQHGDLALIDGDNPYAEEADHE